MDYHKDEINFCNPKRSGAAWHSEQVKSCQISKSSVLNIEKDIIAKKKKHKNKENKKHKWLVSLEETSFVITCRCTWIGIKSFTFCPTFVHNYLYFLI